MPLACTDTGRPSNVPVKPSMPRSPLTWRGVREERLGDVLRAQRVAGEEAGFRVVALLRSEVDRHARHTVTPMLTRTRVFEPRLEEVLDFCAEEPVERVYLEDVARRGLGRFVATEAGGQLEALCHVGANVVPSGSGCAAFARAARSGRARMIIGEERAVGELWERVGRRLRRRASTVPASPSTCSTSHRRPATRACARRGRTISTSSSPRARRRTRTRSGSTRSPATPTAFAGARAPRSVKDARGSGRRTARSSSRPRRRRGRRTPSSSSRCGSIRRRAGRASRSAACAISAGGCSPRCRGVCLFVRAENAPAIRVYEAIGMRRTISYRSLIF